MEKKKNMEIKGIQRNNGWKLPKLGKRYKPPGWRNWAKPKQDKPKEIYAKTHHNQTSES